MQKQKRVIERKSDEESTEEEVESYDRERRRKRMPKMRRQESPAKVQHAQQIPAPFQEAQLKFERELQKLKEKHAQEVQELQRQLHARRELSDSEILWNRIQEKYPFEYRDQMEQKESILCDGVKVIIGEVQLGKSADVAIKACVQMVELRVDVYICVRNTEAEVLQMKEKVEKVWTELGVWDLIKGTSVCESGARNIVTSNKCPNVYIFKYHAKDIREHINISQNRGFDYVLKIDESDIREPPRGDHEFRKPPKKDNCFRVLVENSKIVENISGTSQNILLEWYGIGISQIIRLSIPSNYTGLEQLSYITTFKCDGSNDQNIYRHMYTNWRAQFPNSMRPPQPLTCLDSVEYETNNKLYTRSDELFKVCKELETHFIILTYTGKDGIVFNCSNFTRLQRHCPTIKSYISEKEFLNSEKRPVTRYVFKTKLMITQVFQIFLQCEVHLWFEMVVIVAARMAERAISYSYHGENFVWHLTHGVYNRHAEQCNMIEQNVGRECGRDRNCVPIVYCSEEIKSAIFNSRELRKKMIEEMTLKNLKISRELRDHMTIPTELKTDSSFTRREYLKDESGSSSRVSGDDKEKMVKWKRGENSFISYFFQEFGEHVVKNPIEFIYTRPVLHELIKPTRKLKDPNDLGLASKLNSFLSNISGKRAHGNYLPLLKKRDNFGYAVNEVYYKTICEIFSQ